MNSNRVKIFKTQAINQLNRIVDEADSKPDYETYIDDLFTGFLSLQDELKLNNEELQAAYYNIEEQKATYQQLLHLMPVALVSVDTSGIITYMNQCAIELIDNKLTSLRLSVYRLFEPDDTGWLYNCLHNSGAGEKQEHKLFLSFTENKVLVKVRVLVMEHNNPFNNRLLISIENLQNEIDLHQNQVLLASFLDNSPEPIFAFDWNFTIIMANQSFLTLAGLNKCFIGDINTSAIKIENINELLKLAKAKWLKYQAVADEELSLDSLNNKQKYFRLSFVPLKDGSINGIGLAVKLLDITEEKTEHLEVAQMAFYDYLTGLPNRNLLEDRVSQLLKKSQRDNSSFVICFIDLDHFKTVNDNYGHKVGDLVLQSLTQRMLKEIRQSDTLSRIGGDEFILVMPGMNKSSAISKIQSILNTLQKPVYIANNTFQLSASIGVSAYPDDSHIIVDLFEYADKAMYLAKQQGKNQFTLYENTSF